MKKKSLALTIVTSLMAPVIGMAQVDMSRVLEMQIPNHFRTMNELMGYQAPVPSTDQSVINGLRLGAPISQEGLPANGWTNEIPDELLFGGYTPAERIELALQDKNDGMARGDWLQTAEGVAREIINDTTPSPQWAFVRIILNRCVDILQLTLPVAGRNTSEVARFYSNFMTRCMHHAAAYSNNNVAITQNRYLPDHPQYVLDYLKDFEGLGYSDELNTFRSNFAFGQEMTVLFWSLQSGMISESAQGIILLRILGYIGYDTLADARRRHPAIRKMLVDITRIQNSTQFKNVVNSLRSNYEPLQKDVAGLRLKVKRLMDDFGQRVLEVDGNL